MSQKNQPVKEVFMKEDEAMKKLCPFLAKGVGRSKRNNDYNCVGAECISWMQCEEKEKNGQGYCELLNKTSNT